MQRQPQGSCAARQQRKPYTKPLTSKLTCIWWSVKEYFFCAYPCPYSTLVRANYSVLQFSVSLPPAVFFGTKNGAWLLLRTFFFHHLWPPVTRDKYIQLEIAIGCSVWNLFRKGKIFKKGKCQSCKNLIGHLRFICKKLQLSQWAAVETT